MPPASTRRPPAEIFNPRSNDCCVHAPSSASASVATEPHTKTTSNSQHICCQRKQRAISKIAKLLQSCHMMALMLFMAHLPTMAESMDPAPKFHISPAHCGFGWTNDPNGSYFSFIFICTNHGIICPGPFDYKGVAHMFYQYCPNGGGNGPGPGHRLIRWGHVAGNLSHWLDCN